MKNDEAMEVIKELVKMYHDLREAGKVLSGDYYKGERILRKILGAGNVADKYIPHVLKLKEKLKDKLIRRG